MNHVFQVIGSFLLALLVAGNFALPLLDDEVLNAPPSSGEEYDFDNIAWSLGNGYGYSRYYGSEEWKAPYNNRTYFQTSEEEPFPTTFRPPLYPLFLVSVSKIVGRDFGSWRVVQATVVALSLFFFVLVLYRHFGLRATLIVTPLLLLDSTVRATSLSFNTDAIVLVLSALLFVTTTSSMTNERKALVAGLLYGMLCLLKTTFLLWLPILVTAGLFLTLRKKLKPSALLLFSLVALLQVTPWWIRNWNLTEGRYPFGTEYAINLPLVYSEINHAGHGRWDGYFMRDLNRLLEKEESSLEQELVEADEGIAKFKSWFTEQGSLIPALIIRRVHSLLWKHAPLTQRALLVLSILSWCFLLYKRHWSAWLFLPCIAQIVTVGVTTNIDQGRMFIPLYIWLWGMIGAAIYLETLKQSESPSVQKN